MPSKNSFVSLASQIETLAKNSIEVMTSLNEVVSSTEDTINIPIVDENGQTQVVSLPTVGFFKTELDRLNQNIKTLSTVDQRGAVIQPSRNEFKRVFIADINREPNPVSELSAIADFVAEKNFFFDALLNPLLKIQLDLTNKLDDGVKTVLVKRYVIGFQNDEFGVPTDLGNTAITSFNQTFKNRTNITTEELETWLLNTAGIDADNRGDKINFDEEFHSLDANELQYEGFFTILGTVEDKVNKKMYFQIDTLDYFEISTGQKSQLKMNDELIINTAVASTRYVIVEIRNTSSELEIRMERIEGFEPVPVGVVGGMKYYSPIITKKTVDVPIAFNEYNVVFVKPMNDDNHIIARKFSTGVAFYTNDLTLSSNTNNGDNGKTMQQFYVETVQDFGDLLKDFVDRYIPRSKGVKPTPPVLTNTNFRVVPSNKFLTETTTLESQRKKHQQITQLRSKIDENNKTIQEKNKELFGKNFKTPKDKKDVENQITKLTADVNSDTTLLNSTVNDMLATAQNNTTVTPEYELQGFWQMPAPVQNGQTRPQEAISFYLEFKKANVDGKESDNQTFKVIKEDGTVENAVFSPWKSHWSPLRRRIFDIASQKFVWEEQKLDSIDSPNINSVSLGIQPGESITLRVKTVSEVGYPDSLLESDWSNELTINFPTDLLQPRNPQEIFQKNAELENTRNKIITDLDRKGLSQHLSDSVVFENKFYTHHTDTIAISDPNGKLISVTDKIKQIETAAPVAPLTPLVFTQPWVNYGNNHSVARYYLHEGRVYLTGVIKVDKGEKIKNPLERFPNVDVLLYGQNATNTNYGQIGLLPVGYRPDSKIILPCFTYSGVSDAGRIGRIDILDNGLITLGQGNTFYVSLDGISFRVA